MSKRWIVLLLGGLFVLSSAACDNLNNDTDGGAPDGGGQLDGVTPNPDSAPTPEFVKFANAGDTVEMQAEDGSQFLILPYSVGSAEADAIDYKVKVEAAASSKTSPLKVPGLPKLGLRHTNPALWAKWQKRLALEAWTRSLRERAAKLSNSLPEPMERGRDSRGKVVLREGETCALSSECAVDEVCHALKCAKSITLNVKTFANSAEITAKVVRKASKVAILVEDGETVGDTELDTLMNTFDQTIYPRDVALFGNPVLKDGEPTLASDRNGDGIVWLVLTPKVADKKEAVGFFVATDFTDEADSNKADILWLAPPAAGETLPVLTTMAHEFQHLLSYGTKVYKPKTAGGNGAIEALWLDEGLSHLAEDACGFGGENTTLLDQELFTAWGDTSLITGTDSLAMRGMALTFLRRVFEQKGGVSYESGGGITDKGGAAWLQSVLGSDKVGHEAITATHLDYKKAMDDWMATVALDGRGVSGAELYAYAPLQSDPVTNNQIGVKIRGKRKDAAGDDVDLAGPLEEEIMAGEKDDTLQNASGKFWLFKATAGAVKVTVTSADTDVRFAVIKVK